MQNKDRKIRHFKTPFHNQYTTTVGTGIYVIAMLS